jgi:hypothetical protein
MIWNLLNKIALSCCSYGAPTRLTIFLAGQSSPANGFICHEQRQQSGRARPRGFVTNSAGRHVERRQIASRTVSGFRPDISNAALGQLDVELLQDLRDDAAAGFPAMAVAGVARRFESKLKYKA